MKDVEKLFERSGGPKPHRRLRADFTKQVLNRVDQRASDRRRAAWITEIFTMKLFTKPMMAVSALVVAIALGGTAYAAVGGWPGVVALFGAQQTLPGGDRIVRVDTQKCNYVSAFNVTGQDKSRDDVFYRIKVASKLTNEQVVEMVKGNCDTAEQVAFDQKTVQDALDANPLNKDKIVGGYHSEVMAVSPTSITLKAHISYGEEIRTVVQTFPVADDVLVYQSPHKLSISNVYVGDQVVFQYRASGDALAHSETIAPDKVDASKQIVVAIFKNTKESTAAMNYTKYNGLEFEEVVPCDSGSDGYCTYEQTQQ